ncbi:MAG: hypothetical protein KDA69_12775 [Planctomycetaceae bacterium]|nr:hypothetical protein [Planctomycetaceae bacterium]
MTSPASDLLKTYKPLHDLPALAGVCAFDEAAEPGMGVEECVQRLLRLHFAFRRLMEMLTWRIPGEPVYELKMGFSLHAHYAAEHCTALRERVSEMRQPPLGLEKIPNSHLDILLREIQFAPTTEEFLHGVYGVVVPALVQSLERYMADTNKLADHPTWRLLRFAKVEFDEAAQYGNEALARLPPPEAAQPWLENLRVMLACSGDLDGTQPAESKAYEVKYADSPRPIEKVPQRDERFTDPYNMGVHAEEFLYDSKFHPRDKTLMMYFKRLREIDVPEMMATILAETPDKPWGYYRDMTRQLWDEARHAMLGEVGFVSLGIDWPQFVRVNHTWALGLNTQLDAWERHAVLFFIEQGLMTKTGKRFEWEVGTASGDGLSKVFQDFDWADEVLHARIGRDWYVSEFADINEALTYGDACWSKVLMNWSAWKDEGLTEHENWWPGLYTEFCSLHELTPDQNAMQFHETYSTSRADLEKLPANG